jgi:uncharacterized protein
LPERPLKGRRDGVSLAVRLLPGAAADRLVGVAATATGGAVVKAAVTAPPEEGRANAALLERLAGLVAALPRGRARRC